MPAWDYDIIIVGAGPAGLTAGIYAGRARLQTLLLEKLIYGGQVMTTDLVENYPGFPEGIWLRPQRPHAQASRALRVGVPQRRSPGIDARA